MKANELRIGNWVLYEKYCDKDFKKVQIEFYDMEIICAIQSANYYKPIQLTEKWLVKFGFEKRKLPIGTHWADLNYLYYNKSETLIRMEVVSRRNTTINFKHIKHVHQLQNLYFALTGEELTI